VRGLARVVALLAIQFFVAQLVVGLAWTTPYSLGKDYISDLGNTTCGPFEVGREVLYVCSPWHAVMNVSFVLFGAAMAFSVSLFARALPRSTARNLGLVLLAIAAPGPVLVGLFPEDVNLAIHKVGAGAQFICGNLAMIVLAWPIRRALRRPMLALFSFASGVVGLLATLLFVLEVYLGLGIGGMERFAAYPSPVWLIVVGCLVR
jgi:hypothetical membrane protein